MKIGILSRNANLYSTRRLVEAAIQRGHEAHVVDHLKCNIEIEQKGPSLYYGDDYLTGFDAIIPRIGASVTFYGTAVVRQFEMMNVFTAVNSRGIVHSRDKLRCLQVLSKEGIGLPKTVFTNYSRNVEHVVESAGGAPVVLKLLEGTQGLGVVLAENQNAAQSVFRSIQWFESACNCSGICQRSKGCRYPCVCCRWGSSRSNETSRETGRISFEFTPWWDFPYY
jgi:ribosomal protein S6--L-glutamate ligase